MIASALVMNQIELTGITLSRQLNYVRLLIIYRLFDDYQQLYDSISYYL